MAKVPVNLERVILSRGRWSMVCFTAKENSFGRMEQSIKENSRRMKSLATVVMTGLTAAILKGRLSMVWDMAEVSTLILRKVLFTRENGRVAFVTDLEFSATEMAPFMKVIGRREWRVERERWPIKLGITMKASGASINVTVKVLCIGLHQMRSIQEIGKIITKVGLVLTYG
jgi:hypothetical protein